MLQRCAPAREETNSGICVPSDVDGALKVVFVLHVDKGEIMRFSESVVAPPHTPGHPMLSWFSLDSNTVPPSENRHPIGERPCLSPAIALTRLDFFYAFSKCPEHH